ncbi:MAG: rod shape-determining protein MreC [Defluviitaleaceae bacterium]|nr:rod shape-determining protein MreC [Defluviitaleaceae bacterium]
MLDFIRERKRAFIIGASIVCLVLLVISASERYRPGIVRNALGAVVSPVAGFFSGIGNWAGESIAAIRDMGGLAAENAELRERIFELELQTGRLLLTEEENQVLAELLEISRRYADFPTIGANIIARDPGNWFDTFIIDRGTRDGLARDMVVLAPGGLAGVVVWAGWNHASVVTLIDYTSAVGAQSRRTGDWGIMRGEIALMSHGLAQMEFHNPEAEFAIGDEIITSAMSSIYPPGLLIGHIVDIIDEGGSRFAIIQPAVDFSRLSTLLVITELFDYVLIYEEY